MATLQSVTDKIRGLIDAANSVTGNNDTDLTKAVGTLIAGYNQGGSGEYYRYVTFLGADNETVENTVTVAPHYSCPKSAAPQLYKESTDDTDYTHVGWSLTPEGEAEPYILNNIREDITLYPVFEESVRHYTVRFWDGDKLCGQKQIPYGGSSDYTYHKIGHYFQHWTPEPVNVTSDMDCYGTWEMASFAKDSWAQISANCRAGNAAEYYKVGDEREIYATYGEVVDGRTGENVIVRVAHIGVVDGKHGMVIVISPFRNSKMAYDADYDTSDPLSILGYGGSDVIDYFYDVVPAILPGDVRSVIRSVNKTLISKSAVFDEDQRYPMILETWPLSKSEVSGGYDLFQTDGNPNDALDARIMRLSDGTAVSWMLRDPANATRIEVVQPDGSVRQGSVTEAVAYNVVAFFV